MPIPRQFTSTIRRTDQQVQPIGQLPNWLLQGAGGPSLALPPADLDGNGGDPDYPPLPPPDYPDEPPDPGEPTIPDITDIPTSVEGLLALFDEDLDTPGVQSQIAELAGMSADALAAHFGLEGYGEYFQPVQQGLLQQALERIGGQRTFGLGQARELFGVQAAGVRAGLLGLSQQASQVQAASGFAGAGAIGAAQVTGRRKARRGLAELQIGYESEQARLRFGAEEDIGSLLEQIAAQVGGFGDIAAQLVSGGAGRLLDWLQDLEPWW